MADTKALMPGTLPGGGRNGLPPWPGYVYRGKLTLEVELPLECAAGCGRRMAAERNNDGVCATCRGCYDKAKRPYGVSEHGTEARHAKHIRAGEPPCEPCRLAKNRAWQERRSGQKTLSG
jgi:hypothetical protein